MKTPKRNSAFWKYLESVGVLEHPTEESFAKAKKDYKRIYFKAYNQKRRKAKPQRTVIFNQLEYSIIQKASQKQGTTINDFLKQATLAYINGTVLILEYKKIIQLGLILSDCQNYIKEIAEADTKSFWTKERDYERLTNTLAKLEQQMNDVLQTPHKIEDVITEALQENPAMKDRLLFLLHSVP